MNIGAILTAIWTAVTGGNIWATGGVVALIFGFFLKKFFSSEEQDAIGDWVENTLFVLGSIITIALNKVTVGFWNKVVETPFQALLKIVFNRAEIGIQRGLDSDDKIA